MSKTKLGAILGAAGLLLGTIADATQNAVVKMIGEILVALGAGGFGVGIRDAIGKNGSGR